MEQVSQFKHQVALYQRMAIAQTYSLWIELAKKSVCGEKEVVYW